MMDFDVVSSRTLEEALDTLAEYGDDAKVIAGGQSLLNILKQGLLAPELLVDVRAIDALGGIQLDGGLRIGGAATHRALERSEAVARSFPVLAEMERHLATVQIRNWGTVGGNLCMADPTGDPAPALLALDAEACIARKGGDRRVGLEAFFVDYYETVLEPEEILTAVDVPLPPPRTGVAYEKFRNVEGDAPIVVAAVRVTLEEGGEACKDVRIALGGVAPVPIRAKEAEKVLRGAVPTAEAIAEAAHRAPGETSPIPDITASEEFKRKLVAVLVNRVAAEATAKAKENGPAVPSRENTA
ncbi:MAG: FAD binding domain-containing protein [Planctomycetota bacterium]|jgi:carbon-monoxide dehydrogenase medium subunit